MYHPPPNQERSHKVTRVNLASYGGWPEHILVLQVITGIRAINPELQGQRIGPINLELQEEITGPTFQAWPLFQDPHPNMVVVYSYDLC